MGSKTHNKGGEGEGEHQFRELGGAGKAERCCPRCGADPELNDECWCKREAHAPVSYQTLGLLAGAYVDKSLKRLLTHVAEVDATGFPVRFLCDRADIDNVCPDGYTDEQLAAPATCRVCAKRDPRTRGK